MAEDGPLLAGAGSLTSAPLPVARRVEAAKAARGPFGTQAVASGMQVAPESDGAAKPFYRPYMQRMAWTDGRGGAFSAASGAGVAAGPIVADAVRDAVAGKPAVGLGAIGRAAGGRPDSRLPPRALAGLSGSGAPFGNPGGTLRGRAVIAPVRVYAASGTGAWSSGEGAAIGPIRATEGRPDPGLRTPSLAGELPQAGAPAAKGAEGGGTGGRGGPDPGRGGGGVGAGDPGAAGPVLTIVPAVVERGSPLTVTIASAPARSAVAVFCIDPNGTSCADRDPGSTDAEGRWSRTYPGELTADWSTGTYSGWMTVGDIPTGLAAFEVKVKAADQDAVSGP